MTAKAVTDEQLGGFARKMRELQERLEKGVVPFDDTMRGIQSLIEGQKLLVQQSVGGLNWRRGRTANLTVEVDYSQSIEQLMAQVKAVGWSVNTSITTQRQLDFEGMPEKPTDAQMRQLSVTSPIKSGDVWSADQVLANLKVPGLAFGLHDLLEFIPYRDELLDHGVRFITAMGSRFRRSDGGECVVYLDLVRRDVNLDWLRYGWSDYDSFGRVRN